MSVKVWDKDEIKEKLINGSPLWVEKGVVAIFNKQTLTEKAIEGTNMLNKVGYSATDAKIMSGFTKWLLKNTGNHLSTKQLYVARKKITKYSGQLAKIANNKI